MMSNHTDEARKAAEKVLLKYDRNSGTTIESRNDWDVAVDGAAAIIDQETGLPELKAERDKLREDIEELRGAATTHYRDLYGHPDCLKESGEPTKVENED
jgi:hypothetical protein